MAGADPSEAARRAAALLPPARAVNPNEGPVERALTLALCLGTFLATPIGVAVFLGRQPNGWLLLLAGVPVWLVARWLFFRVRGSETGTVTVDSEGVVHVLTGRRAVRRLQRLFDVGTARWVGPGVIIGFAVGAGVPIGVAVVAVGFDAPSVVLVLMATIAVACWTSSGPSQLC